MGVCIAHFGTEAVVYIAVVRDDDMQISLTESVECPLVAWQIHSSLPKRKTRPPEHGKIMAGHMYTRQRLPAAVRHFSIHAADG
jgi:hypothetical protein